MRNKDQFRGCLVGGAVGDALGYAVEFLDEQEIFDRYGKNGITAYTLCDSVAEIADDTVHGKRTAGMCRKFPDRM